MNERQQLLRRIDELEPQRCPRCHKHNYNAADMNCQCAVAIEIREIGNKLLKERAHRRSKPTTDSHSLIRQFKEEMTVEVYRQLRENNYSIMRIAVEAGIPKTQLYQWRQDNGFVHNEPKAERPMRPQKHNRYDLEYKKYMKMAERNGISRATFYHRVRISEWDYQRAATERVQRQTPKKVEVR